MRYNHETPLLIKIIQIMVWSWLNYRDIKAYKKEMRIWKVRIKAQRRAGIYGAVRAETRRKNHLSTDKLRVIASK